MTGRFIHVRNQWLNLDTLEFAADTGDGNLELTWQRGTIVLTGDRASEVRNLLNAGTVLSFGSTPVTSSAPNTNGHRLTDTVKGLLEKAGAPAPE